MSGGAGRLGRLLAIRRLGEEVERGRLALALASVAEVDAALARQEEVRVDARLTARIALAAGDRGEWLMADAQSEVAGWNRGRLQALQQARASEVPPAMERFLESRREHEQVKQLVEDARQKLKTEQERRAQASADDWFLGRRMRMTR